jgi:hypothetical protein
VADALARSDYRRTGKNGQRKRTWQKMQTRHPTTDEKRRRAISPTEIARLVVVTAERVLAKQLSDADRAAYNQAAARELTVV